MASFPPLLSMLCCVMLCCHRTKQLPGRMQYVSYMQPTADGKTDYLSITVINGATAQVRMERTLPYFVASKRLWQVLVLARTHPIQAAAAAAGVLLAS